MPAPTPHDSLAIAEVEALTIELEQAKREAARWKIVAKAASLVINAMIAEADERAVRAASGG